MDDLLVTASRYVTLFLVWTSAMAALFGSSAASLCWYSNRRGWTHLTEKGPRWFKPLLFVGSLGTGVAIGLIVGIPVGASSVAVKLINEAGPVLIQRGLEAAASPLGIDIHEPISLREVREVVEKIEQARFGKSRTFPSTVMNYGFQRVTDPFVKGARQVLQRVAPGDQVVLIELVDACWQDVQSRVVGARRSLLMTRLLVGYAWLGGFALVGVTVPYGVRRGGRRLEQLKKRSTRRSK